MITVHRRQLEAVCRQRGYDLDAAMACVVSQDGDKWTIDEKHAAYPRTPKHAAYPRTPKHPASPQATSTGGPGTYLKQFFLKWFGQKATPNCSCNAVAARMDTMGPQWCRDNMEWIVEQIRLNAQKRGLPYIRAVVEPIVLLAIRKAERDSKASE